MTRYKKVYIGHGEYAWVPIYRDEIIPSSNRSASDGNEWGIWSSKIMKKFNENTENLVVGDQVILVDHRKEVQGSAPGHFFWVPRMDKYIGTTLKVTKLEVHGIRAKDWGQSTGFNYFWVKKISILDDEMFEI